jgi:hypothetical protein
MSWAAPGFLASYMSPCLKGAKTSGERGEAGQKLRDVTCGRP